MIRLGVIGYGGRIHGMISGPFRALEPDLRVVAVIDPDEEGARARLAPEDQDDVRFFDDIDTMMRTAELDAVAVGTRCNLHADIACQLATYDVPLFLEKPVAISMDQATALERAFDAAYRRRDSAGAGVPISPAGSS